MALSGYTSYHPITIPAAKLVGTGTLGSYCCLVTEDMLLSEVTDTGTYSAANGGGDIAFAADTAGTTQLPCHVRRFVTSATPSSVDVKVWVQLGDVDPTGDHTFYIFYKKSGATQPASTDTYGSRAVYTTKGFRFVTHDCQTDEVTGTSLTQNGNATTGTGVYGDDCGDYDGSGDSSQISISGWDITGNLTTIAWINIDGTGEGYDYAVAYRDSNGHAGIVSRTASSTPRFAYISRSGTTDATGVGKSSNSAAGWHMVQGYHSALGSGITFRQDKSSTGTSSTSGWPSGTNNTAMMIGAYSGGDEDFGGLIGDVWVYEGNLGYDWGDTLYNNTSSPATFASAGTAVRISSGSTIEESISLAVSSGIAPTNVATLEDVLSLGISGGFSLANVATMGESIALNLSKGFSESNTTIQNDSITISGVFDASHSGGVLLEDSISLGATLGATGSGVIVIEDSISMGLSAGAGSGNIATIEDSIILDLSSSVSLSNIISAFNDVSVDFVADVSATAGLDLQDSISLAVDLGETNTAALTANEDIGLSVANGITAQSIANLVSAIALGVSAGVYAQDDSPQNITEAISLGLSLANTITTTMDAEGAVSVGFTGNVQSSGVIVTADGLALNLSLGYSNANNVDAIANITLGLESTLVASGILTIQEAINLGFDAGAAIASSLSALTPNERRTFTVSARDKTSTPQNNRTLTVAISSRRKDA